MIEGPKACGKTETARQKAKSEVLLDVDDAARAAAELDPTLVLDGAVPRLLAEWQRVPALWNHVRRLADERGPGQFILTGSAVPADEESRHTGASRITRMRMRPMSLFESGFSTGAISLEGLLNGDPARSPDTGATVPAITEQICRGGWPAFQTLSAKQAMVGVSGYLEEVRRTDVNRVDSSRRDPNRVGRLMRSLARNVATSAKISRLAADTDGEDGQLSRDTVYDYLNALERLMIVEDQPPWGNHLRSKAQAITSSTRHYVDPSLAVAAIGASPERLLKDLNYLGYLFESLVVRDLQIYVQPLEGTISHYRDSDGLEVDAIVEAKDGRWAALEVKRRGAAAIDEAATHLLKFAAKVDTKKIGAPAFIGIIVGAGFGYVRPDGVAVIPVSALRN